MSTTRHRCKVVHLTSVHNIETDTRIYLRECRTLATSGYDVTLIAPGEGGWSREGVRFAPVPQPQSRRERMVRTTRLVYQAARAQRADVYHFHDPELIPIGVALSGGNTKVVYDIHEDMPVLIRSKEWIHPWLRTGAAGVTATVEQLATRRFDLLVTATTPIAARFPTRPTVVVQNFPFLDELAAGPTTSYRDRPPVIAYVGNLQPSRGVKEMVLAAGRMDRRFDVHLEFAGGFNPPELEHELDTLPGRSAVTLLGWQDRRGVQALLSRARAGLCVLHPLPNFVEAQPTKLYEYMAASIPVIASDFPAWRKIVDKQHCGILVDPLHPEAIASAITWLLDHPDEAEAMGRRGRTAVETSYNWEAESRALLDAYASLLG